MAKFSKVSKVTVVVRGCYAGKKVVIVKPHDEGPKNHSFLHALVAGIERYPLKITGKHDPKKIAKRTKIRPFIKVLNYNHLLPTRYTLDIESFEEAKKVIRKALEERHKASKNQWFFTKLGFSMRQKILIDTTNIAIDCFVIKKKKKKRRKEKSMDVQMSGQLGTKIYFFQF